MTTTFFPLSNINQFFTISQLKQKKNDRKQQQQQQQYLFTFIAEIRLQSGGVVTKE